MDAIETILRQGAEYLWFLALAVIGGTINYISRVRRNAALKFSIIELLGEWCAAGFVGLMTLYLGLWLNWPPPLIGLSCGISGHLAGRILYIVDSRAGDVIDAAVDHWIGKK